MYMYKRTEPQLWTVGYHDGHTFEPESDHGCPGCASRRVILLNGGDPDKDDSPHRYHDATDYIDGFDDDEDGEDG